MENRSHRPRVVDHVEAHARIEEVCVCGQRTLWRFIHSELEGSGGGCVAEGARTIMSGCKEIKRKRSPPQKK